MISLARSFIWVLLPGFVLTVGAQPSSQVDSFAARDQRLGRGDARAAGVMPSSSADHVRRADSSDRRRNRLGWVVRLFDEWTMGW